METYVFELNKADISQVGNSEVGRLHGDDDLHQMHRLRPHQIQRRAAPAAAAAAEATAICHPFPRSFRPGRLEEFEENLTPAQQEEPWTGHSAMEEGFIRHVFRPQTKTKSRYPYPAFITSNDREHVLTCFQPLRPKTLGMFHMNKGSACIVVRNYIYLGCFYLSLS